MRRWIVAGVVLLLVAAALLSLVEEDARPAVVAVEFPRGPRPAEYERLARRRTLPAAPAVPAPGAPVDPAPRRDPFLVALPATPGDAVVVFEANALRHSRLGELFVACMLARDANAFADVERETGIDVLKDVDRVAFAGRAVVVSGFFDRARWDALERERLVPAPYGEAATIWTAPAPGDGERPVLATWRDQLVVVAPDETWARRAIDQVEGRLEPAVTLPDDMAYGEVYGLVPGDALRRLAGLGNGADDLPARIAAAASRVEIHVDAMADVAAVVKVRGDDAARLSDLSRALGGAIAAARLEAMATKDDQLASLLESARVALEGDRAFSLELALPADRLEGWFSKCGGDGPAAR